MSESTRERPWPENASPTPEQFADWYVTLDRPERVRVAEALAANADRANRCFIEGHDSLLHEVNRASSRTRRYRNAWLSARRRHHLENVLRAIRDEQEASHA